MAYSLGNSEIQRRESIKGYSALEALGSVELFQHMEQKQSKGYEVDVKSKGAKVEEGEIRLMRKWC